MLLLLTFWTACVPADPPAPVDPCADPATAPPGTICTWAGVPGEARWEDEGHHRLDGGLYLPRDVVLAPDGAVYVVDQRRHQVLRVGTDDRVVTVAGTGWPGDGPEGPALEALFRSPVRAAVHPDDPNLLYVAGHQQARVVVVDLAAGTVAFAAGTGQRGASDGDGGPAVDAAVDLPTAVVFDDDGSWFFIDAPQQAIRRVGADGVVERFAGRPPEYLAELDILYPAQGWAGDGGPAIDATFRLYGGGRDAAGGDLLRVDRTLYVADSYNHVVRAIDLDTGVIRHVAGTGEEDGHAGDGGPAATARLHVPLGLAADEEGRLYIADTENHCVRVVGLDGTIERFAGVCQRDGGFGGDGGPATEARLHSPTGIEVGPEFVYIADTVNQVVRVVRR